ncbi:MAG TPA: alpha/beta hydrolase [Verrucomicrobiae bacterium]|nr:alpha/beta hydrolase [Verrucomicrobiae bacterium]
MKSGTRSGLRLTLLLLLVGGVYLVMHNYEQQFVYAPSPFIKKTPREAKLSFDNIALTTDDGVNIQGWFVPAHAPEDPPMTNASTPTLLFFHGGVGNISDYLPKVHLLHDMGLDVFTVDYHGYGKSGGTPSESGLASDALAAYFYLRDNRHVNPERLYLYGEDLGAAVAIDLAAKKVPAAGLITEGAIASVIEKIEEAWPLIPWQFLLRNKFDSVTNIRDVHMPILIIHSTEDNVVPFNDSHRLWALAHEPKELVEIHGAHCDAFVHSLDSFDLYYDKVSRFVFEQPKDKTADAPVSAQTAAPASKDPTP